MFLQYIEVAEIFALALPRAQALSRHRAALLRIGERPRNRLREFITFYVDFSRLEVRIAYQEAAGGVFRMLPPRFPRRF
jgi:hypothetical protein